MAKIFGTSSEDECTSRNSKPPIPNTSGGQTLEAPQVPIKSAKLSVDQVFSDSETEKQLESPALESDSDCLPSGPPTSSFPSVKSEEQKALSPPRTTRSDSSPVANEEFINSKAL